MDFLTEWSPEALEDLEMIAQYIARDSEFYARSVVREILSVAAGIGEAPSIGRVVPELGDENLRERFVYSYHLIYRIESSRIIIVAYMTFSRKDLWQEVKKRSFDG